MNSQRKFEKNFSFEFFPPKTVQGFENMCKVRDALGKLNPKYFSVTFGAGGSTQQGTFDTVQAIQQAGYEVAPHLSCIGSNKENIRSLLQHYQKNNIHKIVALRGDIPSGMGGIGEFRYANELVAFIRAETGDHFHIEVAAYPEFHPQAENAKKDLLNFKNKVDAGANSAITQYFYNAEAYFCFIDDCEKMGMNVPIVPGIMPITNYTQLARFSDTCGTEIPRWIRRRLEAFADDVESLRAFGLDVTTALCEKLLAEGCPGLHFYTMNQSGPTATIWKRLGLST